MMTFAYVLIVIGVIGLLASLVFVYKKLNMAQLSMSALSGNTKEHRQGLSGKLPWWNLQAPEIDMRASVILTSGGVHVMPWETFLAEKAQSIKPRAYETSDGVLFGTWATALTPLEGFLANMVKRTPGAGALMTLAKIELAMSQMVFGMTTETALKSKQEIGNVVAMVFGGEDVTSPHEAAAEKRIEAREFRKAVQDMVSAQTDPDKAANNVLIATGMAKKNVFQVEGLEETLKGIAEAFFRRQS